MCVNFYYTFVRYNKFTGQGQGSDWVLADQCCQASCKTYEHMKSKLQIWYFIVTSISFLLYLFYTISKKDDKNNMKSNLNQI